MGGETAAGETRTAPAPRQGRAIHVAGRTAPSARPLLNPKKNESAGIRSFWRSSDEKSVGGFLKKRFAPARPFHASERRGFPFSTLINDCIFGMYVLYYNIEKCEKTL